MAVIPSNLTVPATGVVANGVALLQATQATGVVVHSQNFVDSVQAKVSVNHTMLQSCKSLAKCANFVFYGTALASFGIAAVINPAGLPIIAIGGGLLLGAGALVRSALVTGAERLVTTRQRIDELAQVHSDAKDPVTLGLSVKNRPDVTIDILTDLKQEIVDKIANCTRTKIDWDSIIGVCEDMLDEMGELGVSSEHEGYRKVLELKTRAELKNKQLADAAWDLIAQGQRVPAWIEGQRVRVEKLREKLTREERLAALQDKLTGLVGKVAELTVESDDTIAETEKLTAEIVATEELMDRVDALTEVEAYLALPQFSDLSEASLDDFRKKVEAKRAIIEAEVVEGNHG